MSPPSDQNTSESGSDIDPGADMVRPTSTPSPPAESRNNERDQPYLENGDGDMANTPMEDNSQAIRQRDPAHLAPLPGSTDAITDPCDLDRISESERQPEGDYVVPSRGVKRPRTSAADAYARVIREQEEEEQREKETLKARFLSSLDSYGNPRPPPLPRVGSVGQRLTADEDEIMREYYRLLDIFFDLFPHLEYDSDRPGIARPKFVEQDGWVHDSRSARPPPEVASEGPLDSRQSPEHLRERDGPMINPNLPSAADVQVDMAAMQANFIGFEREAPEAPPLTEFLSAPFQAVHFVPKEPTFPWEHKEIPDPSRSDAVARGSHRFRFETGPSPLDQRMALDLRTTVYLAIVTQLPEVQQEDFIIRPPSTRGRWIYVDINVVNPKVYNEFKRLNIQWGSLQSTLAFSAAPLTDHQVVFRLSNLDGRIKIENVVNRVCATLRGHVKLSDAWGMYSKHPTNNNAERLQFEGIIYLLGTVSDIDLIQRIPAFVDLNGIPLASGEYPLWYNGRPTYCTSCRPIPGRHHLAAECPKSNRLGPPRSGGRYFQPQM